MSFWPAPVITSWATSNFRCSAVCWPSRRALEVARPMREVGVPFRATLTLSLWNWPGPFRLVGLVAQDVEAAGHVLDLAEDLAEVVGVPEEATSRLGGDEVQRLASGTLRVQVLGAPGVSSGSSSPPRPVTSTACTTVSALERTRVISAKVSRRPAVAEAGVRVDLPQPALGDRLRRGASVGALHAHEGLRSRSPRRSRGAACGPPRCAGPCPAPRGCQSRPSTCCS